MKIVSDSSPFIQASSEPGYGRGMKRAILLAGMLILPLFGHDWHRHAATDKEDPGEPGLADQASRGESLLARWNLALIEPVAPGGGVGGGTASVHASVFGAFGPGVRTHQDDRFVYIESDGLPAHSMMVGITAWQQQVPLPQAYVGANAWRIPLHPTASTSPVSIRGRFLRGAVAIAANGIPIFNPQNNRGEVSKEIGELDAWGGHCGRADDYHYHAAPLHLQDVLGKALPIAFAMDGYPIHGLEEPNGSIPAGLDAFNGHTTPGLGYHYHASERYPYVNGGFHGQVIEREGQVDPQPRAEPIRPSLQPLRGARITGFSVATNDGGYTLSYVVAGGEGTVRYRQVADGRWLFRFAGPDGSTVEETYGRRLGQGRGGGGAVNQARPRREGPDPNPQDAPVPKVRGGGLDGAGPESFVLSSPVVARDGGLPVDYTGDGAGMTLPLEWKGEPSGTRNFAISMHHVDPEGRTKWYWTLYNLPGVVHRLETNANGGGVLGNNSIQRGVGYAPPHSKGPGLKRYVVSVYALSGVVDPGLPPEQVGYPELLKAMDGKILGRADLPVTYSREGGGGEAVEAPGSERRGGTRSRQGSGRVVASGSEGARVPGGLVKPTMADTLRVNIYADNWFVLYINGKLRAVDPIEFTPHNVVSVDILPEYPMTIAVMAKDNADPSTGLEYGDHIGDGGFIIKFGDGTVSDAKWKAKNFFRWPIGRDVRNPRVEHLPIPKDWYAADFDDSAWGAAVEYSEERVNPKEPFYAADFQGAKFIWTADLDLDNTVIFRTRVEKPGWKPRWNTKPDMDISHAPLE